MTTNLNFSKQSCLNAFINFSDKNFFKHNLKDDNTSDLFMENFFNILINPRVDKDKSIDELRQICNGYLIFMDYVDYGRNQEIFLNERLTEFEKIREMVKENEGTVEGYSLNIEMYNYLKLKNEK